MKKITKALAAFVSAAALSVSGTASVIPAVMTNNAVTAQAVDTNNDD